MTTRTPLDSFETGLLDELREAVDSQQVAVHRRRPVRYVAAAAAVTAALAVGMTVTMSARPAYAVQQQPNGDVVVTIDRLSDSAGLEQALADHGVTAHVEYRRLFGFDSLPAGAAGVDPGLCRQASPTVERDGGAVTITIPRLLVRSGADMWISTGGDTAAAPSTTMELAVGNRNRGCATSDRQDSYISWNH